MAGAVAQHQADGVEWILVNMDREPVKGGLPAWIQAYNLEAARHYRVLKPVMLQVVDRVEPKWDGGLPATLLIAPGYRKFFMRQLTERQCLQELDQLVQSQKKSG